MIFSRRMLLRAAYQGTLIDMLNFELIESAGQRRLLYKLGLLTERQPT